jgi:KUP system potassium uptake protein
LAAVVVEVLGSEVVDVEHAHHGPDVGIPVLRAARRADLGYRDDGIMHVSIRYGFQDEHNVPDALRQAAEQGLESEIDIDNASYFVSRITIVRGDAPDMSTWRKKLFLAMANTSTNPVELFCLPEHRIVTIGSYVEF